MFSTVGVCVIAHYCGGELEKVSLFSKSSSSCDGEDTETDDCCNDDAKHVVFQSDFTFYTLVHDAKIAVNQLFIIKPAFIDIAFQPVSQSHFLAYKKNHPPNLVQDHIVSFSVIRI